MSVETTDQLPIIPETEIIEPIVQCGVLYLGSGPPSPGRRGIDSIQEPFSHRYPVDGTNTVRGIDSILSIYNNGIQLTFARQPHVVIFFPFSSLIYCACLRYSIVENDQTSLIDWRFVTLDSTEKNQSKHPPLFCAIIQRTQILTGDECHCFITKSDDAALALVRTISEVYAKLQANIKPLRSPIFYQLDRYRRKISETTGIIYLSPATKDESQLENNHNSISSINRQVLLDPSCDGFFYRTDAIIIDKWQLWDDDNLTGSRPHPPASPFGQHQGLYHDDVTNEIHQYLRHMDDEERSSSCSCSSSSTENDRHHHDKSKSKYNTDPFNASFSHSHTSSFDPSLIQNTTEIKKLPIIIEKIVPNPMLTRPPQYILEQSQQPDDNSIPYSDIYQVNERGEKITQEGNRILFMDVIQPDIINNKHESKPSKTHRKRSKHIPMIDLRTFENLLQDKQSKQHEKNINNQDLSTSDMLEIVEGYFEDYKGRKLKLNGDDAQKILDHFEASHKKQHRQTSNSNNKTHRRRRSHSTLTTGPSVNYVERSAIKPPSIEQEQQSISSNEYVSNTYGTSSSPSHYDSQPSDDTNNIPGIEQDYISPFRYMQSSVNPILFREYRHAFNGI